MKNCYICLPIAGREEDIFERAEQAKKEIAELGFEPVSPLDLNAIGEEELKEHTRRDITAWYMGRDIEDAKVMKLLSDTDINAIDKLTEHVKINNSNIVNYLVVDLCENSSPEEGLKFSDEAMETMRLIRKFNSERIYKNEKIEPTVRYFTVLMNEIFYTLKKEFNGENTIRNLKRMGRYYPMLSEEFIDWLANYTNIKERDESEYKNKLIYNLSDLKDYERAIIDYMSGMTDNYIVKIYNEIVSF